MSSDPGAPSGGAYEWLQRGLALLSSGDAEAAAVLLERANRDQPGSASVLEALARAQFDAGRIGEAAHTFAALVEAAPDADYAHFGLGLSLTRLDRFAEAVEHLALAVAMRPDRPEYRDSLTQARATLRARKEASHG
ncbi:Tetratricopeptide repeat-containing protein [Quadrisphaera granulorum]|uniref:Tetratricopeptide repeat protein n=1 Tax=Quadrisphaera granulorum TaxID=317664 RepID=A0A315ZVH3_9ACTN|nr:tetratricopeptide repeat protein [Quadrisphaera granulorum]PWJ49252.1 tetratricopeptide repeat protein [Quadrisphaera granulorum]SZE98169.1 Tetratricopeptide repeat-containing protein [Quadrisphaera granulorum]